MPTFYEFFAGGGMARAGLGPEWDCLFANDFDQKKAAAYRANWGGHELRVEDINLIETKDLPSEVDLAWASFPCQDLSLAGYAEGIGSPTAEQQTRSGTFWPFWNLMCRLNDENRGPRIIVLENVTGTLTSNKGSDFEAIADCFASAGYRFGALIIDAVKFLPHSRPRLFIVGVREGIKIPRRFVGDAPSESWNSPALVSAHAHLPESSSKKWVWWKLRKAPKRNVVFSDLVQENPEGCSWNSDSETTALLSLMTPLHIAKIETEKKKGCRRVGTLYKRSRKNVQQAEVRFDDIAGCLRTPKGGSSRQTIVVVDGESVRSRLLSPREAARLMGLPDSYKLPDNYTNAYYLAGDGVVVPAVRHLAAHLLEPILAANALSSPQLAAE